MLPSNVKVCWLRIRINIVHINSNSIPLLIISHFFVDFFFLLFQQSFHFAFLRALVYLLVYLFCTFFFFFLFASLVLLFRLFCNFILLASSRRCGDSIARLGCVSNLDGNENTRGIDTPLTYITANKIQYIFRWTYGDWEYSAHPLYDPIYVYAELCVCNFQLRIVWVHHTSSYVNRLLK